MATIDVGFAILPPWNETPLAARQSAPFVEPVEALVVGPTTARVGPARESTMIREPPYLGCYFFNSLSIRRWARYSRSPFLHPCNPRHPWFKSTHPAPPTDGRFASTSGPT